MNSIEKNILGEKGSLTSMGYKVIGLIFSLALIGIILIISSVEKRNLMKHYETTTGEITSIDEFNKSSGRLTFRFKFYVDKKVYSGSRMFGCGDNNFKLQNVLRNKIMTVVYEQDDPGTCALLMTRQDYGKFKLNISEDALPLLSFIENTCTSSDN